MKVNIIAIAIIPNFELKSSSDYIFHVAVKGNLMIITNGSNCFIIRPE